MAVTGAIFKALTFNGESSRNYGVYITGSAVYNAPNRDVEMITIPGRNGSFPLDHGRFENIEVTYPAGVYADNEADFAKAISDFRNMLCSAKGYCRLEDEYNPDEYRMAIYKSGLEVEPAQLKAGEFDITFECKPQRFLTSGETATTITSGDEVTNPTPFASSPLLLTKGYGTLSFNNKTVTINNAGTMGQMVLWESATLNALTGSIDLAFDSWAFKATDSFTFNVFDNIVTELAPSSQTASNPNAVLTSENVTVIEAGGTQTTAKHLQVKLPVTITVGTASTTTNTTKYTQGSKWIQVVMMVTYDGNGHITYTVVETDTGNVTIYNQYCDMNVPATTAISTLSRLGDPTYIDFDLGEVYMMNSGKPVSLNRFVDLGSDLAVLEPGSNTFTFDNTFTEVKVVPRWWKL